MGYTPGQLDAVSRYLGLPQGYAPAGIPPAAPTVTMPVVEMGPTPPMPVVNPPPGAAAPMPVYSPPVAVNPDAAALSAQLGLAPPAPAPPQAPSSPVSPLAQGLQLPAGIAPPGSTPAVMAPTPPNAAAVPPVHAASPPPVAAPPASPRPAGGPVGVPAPAAPQGPSWTQKRRADEQAYLASFGDERAALQRANEAGTVVRDEDAQAEARIARQKEEYAANEASFQRDEAAARDAFRAQTQKQIDEVRSETIDPGRLYRDSGALTGVMVGIGGALAGMSAALNKTDPDAFAKVIQRHIDRDVDAQVRGLAQKNASIADRNTMYAQLVADNRDAVLSRAQTTAAMLESARGMAAAEAKRLGTPEAQARFEALDAQLARQQAQAHAQVDGAEEQAALRAAQALASARAAAQARAEARADKMREFGVTLEKLRLEDKKIELEHGDGANKPNGLNQTFVAVGKDEAGNPTGYHVRDAETAKKRTDDLATGRALLKMYDQIINNREQEGKLGRFTSRGEGSPLGTPKWKTDNAVLAKKVILAEKNIDKLGALSGSDMELEALGDVNADDVLGDTTTDRLRMRRKLIEDNLKLAEQGEAGTRTRKVVTPGGRAAFVPLDGPANAPNNPKVVKRNPLQ